MGCLTCEQMRLLEDRAFKGGATSEGLMEKAGRGIARIIMRRYPSPGKAIACIGSGNNGGDALVALRYLAGAGWRVQVRCAVESSQLRALPRKKWRELDGMVDCSEHAVEGPRIILDGLLGIGASGALRDPLAASAVWMNTQRQRRDTDVIAMDIPSGIHGDTGEPYQGAVVADLTLTIGVPKRGLLLPAAVNHTGSLETVPLAELPIPPDGDLVLNDVHRLRGLLGRRPHDFHKGNAGRVGIIAGSRGMLGAAVLCSTAALRAGAGLVTLFTNEQNYPLLASMLPPEVMLQPVAALDEVDTEAFDALAVGPGMGLAVEGGDMWQDREFFSLLERLRQPVVLDADGLNRVAKSGKEQYVRPHMTLTPHPGEMRRLFPQSDAMGRLEAVRQFVEKFPETTLLLKGTHSLIAQGDCPIYVNGSGHAGMASGGQGDVLTGVIAALTTQKIGQLRAACLGAWLCGRAGEIAVVQGVASAESLLASDVVHHLGTAFRELS